MVFEDLHAQYDSKNTVFPVCNESIAMWRRALDGVQVENAASVCSGGEVSFFGILPSVTKTLQLIDHAYASMYYAIGKLFAVEKLGAKEAHKALTTGTREDLLPVFKEGNKNLPTTEASPRRESWANPFSTLRLHSILKGITTEDFEAFASNKDKLRFAHGDLNDLVGHGPYDLLYLSNALDYDGRHGGNYSVKKLVKPGGLIAFSRSKYYRVPAAVEEFETLFSEEVERDYDLGQNLLGWRYNLVKVPE